MIKEVFNNYDAFYNMVLSTTLMSNTKNKTLDTDAEKIILFIGEAYGLSTTLITEFTSLILNDLSTVARTLDENAIFGQRRLDAEENDLAALIDIKCDVLEMLGRIKQSGDSINFNWFDYSHYRVYEPNSRFWQLMRSSGTGDLISTRQTGILLFLGIGCKQDTNAALIRLKQCAFWGDVAAMFYLAYAYKTLKDEKNALVYSQLAELSVKYLDSGYTVLPKEEKASHSEEACVYYVYISSIKQDIVHEKNLPRINFSFLEALSSDTLDYYERMHYINNFSDFEWREITNSSEKPSKKIGFKN